MARRGRPPFLDRRRYRRTRLRDAACLLPVLGAALLLVPLLWPASGQGTPPSNAGALLYLFGVWAGPILAAGILSRLLRSGGQPEDAPEDGL
ncbi:hypothetical protein ruthe_01288 [Rubellimicrobium thermophilum DSM 16684]|uniref:Uncharacterized protein n=1 Tax=Rubellimicrobium thermophilum DSM 16684 TaxID=1123069 RepID=S9R3A9_9RHOB|nr:hypothetical protein [Rubellimicrobium thermophilum]EPX86473.1 hypothetical protein ruthe_01288 [Rubellimicrobium thermophilum DSM 16684]